MRNLGLKIGLVSLGLAACVPQQYSSGRYISAEEILAAEGRWSIVELKQESKSYDPQTAHMNAREKVNPSKTSRSSTRGYTSHPDAKDMAENIHMRVLKLDTSSGSGFGSSLSGYKKTGQKFVGLVLSPKKKPRAYANNVEAEMAMNDGRSVIMPQHKPVVSDFNFSPNMVSAAPKKGIASQLLASGGYPEVLRMRMGDHPDKTRLVFDLNNAAEFRSALIENDQFLVLEVMNSTWSSDVEKEFAGHPLVKSYSARAGEDSVTFVLELKKPSRLVWSTMLPPNKSNESYRIVLDVKAL